MKKRFFILLLLLGLVACNWLLPKSQDVPPTVITERTAVPPNPKITPEEKTQDITVSGFTVVRLKPEDGELSTMLAEEAHKALALNQMPVVEFDATWCPPCVAIDKAIQEENELMLNAYAGTYIIKLDVDEWGWDNGKVEFFNFEAIPIYFKLDHQGVPTGETIDGGAWGEDIPENIAPVMDAFFHTN
ncbi:MAG TPA: thioredoxin family protein [Anaerolineales bacterium]|nr:thioredoxin family protein [Anaerolineales bacterium]